MFTIHRFRNCRPADRANRSRPRAGKLGDHAEDIARLLTLEQGKPLGGLGSRFELGGAQAWARFTGTLGPPVKVVQDDTTGRVELHRKPIGVIGSNQRGPGHQHRRGDERASGHSQDRLHLVLRHGRKDQADGRPHDEAVDAGTRRQRRGHRLARLRPAAIAEGLFWGAFINNGQTSAAMKRLYVHDSIHDVSGIAVGSLSALGGIGLVVLYRATMLLALPALRMRGLCLALVTLMVAGGLEVVFTAFQFPNGGSGFWGVGPSFSAPMRRSTIAPDDANYLRYCLAGLVLGFLLVEAHRRSEAAPASGTAQSSRRSCTAWPRAC